MKPHVRHVSPVDETHFNFSCAQGGFLDSPGQQVNQSRAVADHQARDTAILGRERLPKLTYGLLVLLALIVLLGQTHNTEQDLQLKAACT